MGNTLVAYRVSQGSEAILNVVEHVSMITIGGDDVEPDIRELIRLLDEISEANVAKVFSRGKAAKSFWPSVTDELLKQSIRPFVDKRICSALPLIAKNGVAVYRKSDRYQTINVNDRLSLAPPFKCSPRFFFTLTDSGDLLYMLKVSDGVADVSLFHSELDELSASPAVFVSGGVIYSVRGNFPFSKFRPFSAKQRIVVEPRLVDMYMQKVVGPSIASYQVSAYGFSIERKKSAPRIELKAVSSIFGFGFHLIFIYEDFDGSDSACNFSVKSRPVSLTKNDEGRYVFRVVIRDYRTEDRIESALIQEMGLRDMGGVLAPDTNANVEDLVKWVYGQQDMLTELGVKVSIEDEGREFYSEAWNMRTESSSSIDWFDLHIVVDVGKYHIPFKRFFRFISRADNKYPLPDGSVFLIPDEWFEQWSGIIPLVQNASDDDDSIKIDRGCAALLPDFLSSVGEAGVADCNQEPPLASEDFSLYVNASLRPYQKLGACWMSALAHNGHGGILADDMGLGKTLQVIAMLASYYQEPLSSDKEMFRRNETGRGASLVVMPVSLIFNWQNELAKFAPQLSVYVYMGKNAVNGQTLPLILAQYHVVLTSYGIARSCADSLSRVGFECLVLDESHWVKNPSSKTYAALKMLNAKVHFNLSGTPVENSLTDLWAQMNIVNPGLLGSRLSFEHCYGRPAEKSLDDGLMTRLRSVTHPYILRRSKEQVLTELPQLTVQTIVCAMTDEQKELYEREKSACRNALLDAGHDAGRRRFQILQALTRLRLIANHPALCSDDYSGGSGKMDVVIDHIVNIAMSGHKMLVFSSFVRDLEMVALRLDALSLRHLKLIGSTRDRDEVVSSFSSGETPVLLMSLKAGGVGLNLTCADYVLMLNPWWNPAAERQAYGRAHRMGQKSSVSVLRFISQDTIEQKIDEMQAQKLLLASTAVQETMPDASKDALPTDAELELMLAE